MSEPHTNSPPYPLLMPLTLAGAIPFAVCAFGVWLHWPLGFNPFYVSVVYAAIILSFIGGIHWGLFLQPKRPKAWVIVSSNLLALFGWLGSMAFQAVPTDVYLFFILSFVTAFWIDFKLYKAGFLTRSFYRLRQIITPIIAICLLMLAAARFLLESSGHI